MARVLVVDDNDLLRGMLRRFFETEGFGVTTAIDGEDCLEQFHRQRFDIVICDIFMPNKGGLVAVQSIRGLAPEVPIIVMTAAELTGAQIESVLGPIPTIAKPFRPRQLLTLVRKCLS
jgi:DNA-binding response OmpR family regulator